MPYAKDFPHATNMDTPFFPYVVSIVEQAPVRINARSLKSNAIRQEWIPYTKVHVATYMIVAALALIYNGICFMHNFGRTSLHKTNFLDAIFGEEALLYSVVVQWMLIFCVFVMGITLEQCIPQPLHVFLSILATNGNSILFALNVKKVIDEVIRTSSEYFIFITLLFLLSTALCVSYIMALKYQRKQKRLYFTPFQFCPALQARESRLQKAENIKTTSDLKTSKISVIP